MSLAHAKVEVIQAQNAPETRKRPNPTPAGDWILR